jgi:NADH-quinone oxidoreductase subunit G
MREGLGSANIDSRIAGALPLELHRALGEPGLQAKVSDLEFAHAVLALECDLVPDAAILDLRLRKGIRRHGMKLVRASAADLLADPGELVAKLKEAGPADGTSAEIVVLWGERLTAGPDGARAAQALLDLAGTLGIADTDNAGLLEIPAQSNGRGLREAGVLPNAGPGLSPVDEDTLGGAPHAGGPPIAGGRQASGLDARAIARALGEGELSCLYLLGADPLTGAADEQDRELWGRALASATTVISHAMFLTDAIREHADVVFPAGAYPEKEGTVVHPDGRIQRLRPAVAKPGESRAEWQVIADVAARVGIDLEVLTGGMASQQLFDAVPQYAGLTLEQIGGKGVRPHERATMVSS